MNKAACQRVQAYIAQEVGAELRDAVTCKVQEMFPEINLPQPMLANNRIVSILQCSLSANTRTCPRAHAHMTHTHTCNIPIPLSLPQAQSHFEEGQRLYGSQRYSDAANSWGRAVDLKHAQSHALLSHMLAEGRLDVPVDRQRAFELASAGAGMGCAHSKGVLGLCYSGGYSGGYGVAADHAKAVSLGRESAAAGSCMGQAVVAMCYDLGKGVAQDYAEAVRFLRLAAAQGHAIAQINLGGMFRKGLGVAQDETETVRFWRLAAAQGLADAQFNLGTMLFNGEGVAQDRAESIRLYRLAAAQGNANAIEGLRVLDAFRARGGVIR